MKKLQKDQILPIIGFAFSVILALIAIAYGIWKEVRLIELQNQLNALVSTENREEPTATTPPLTQVIPPPRAGPQGLNFFHRRRRQCCYQA